MVGSLSYFIQNVSRSSTTVNYSCQRLSTRYPIQAAHLPEKSGQEWDGIAWRQVWGHLVWQCNSLTASIYKKHFHSGVLKPDEFQFDQTDHR